MEERIERQIDLNESKVIYKNHTLWLSSFELQSGGWVPKAVIVIPEEAGNGERELRGEATYATLEEADTAAFLMGKDWIETKRPDERSAQDITLP